MHIAEDTIREMYAILDTVAKSAPIHKLAYDVDILSWFDFDAIKLLIKMDVLNFALYLMSKIRINWQEEIKEMSDILNREISVDELNCIERSSAVCHYYNREDKIPEFLKELVLKENELYLYYHCNFNLSLKLSMCLLNMAKKFIINYSLYNPDFTEFYDDDFEELVEIEESEDDDEFEEIEESEDDDDFEEIEESEDDDDFEEIEESENDDEFEEIEESEDDDDFEEIEESEDDDDFEEIEEMDDNDSDSMTAYSVFFDMENSNYVFIEKYMNDILEYLNSNLDTMENNVPILLKKQDIAAPKKGM